MPKLSLENQSRVRAYLQNLHNLYQISIIVSICGYCNDWTGVKDGAGVYGISHGICLKCMEKKPWLTTRVG